MGLRELVESRLRGTRPGGDPLAALAAELSPAQLDELRRHLPEPLTPAAVMVPLVDRPEGMTVLLTQRASHLKAHPGQISFPGGRVEEVDAGPWEAALREAREEIGLAPGYASLVGYLADHLVLTGFRITPRSRSSGPASSSRSTSPRSRTSSRCRSRSCSTRPTGSRGSASIRATRSGPGTSPGAAATSGEPPLRCCSTSRPAAGALSMSIIRLQEIMAALRNPAGGCPWDLEQTWGSIAPHTIEEAYELADAIEHGDAGKVRDELGDLLFQVVFQARIAEERGLFDFEDVAATVAEKLERRHPHVFGSATVRTAEEQTVAWEAHKAAERRAAGGPAGVLDGIALGLPALTRAAKLGRRAAGVGFDWRRAIDVLDKVEEECAELREALVASDADASRRARGPALQPRTARAAPAGRSRGGAAPGERQVRASLPPRRGSARRRGTRGE